MKITLWEGLEKSNFQQLSKEVYLIDYLFGFIV